MKLNTELIRQLAKEKGISYRKLAAQAGLGLTTISQTFRGATCSSDTAERIAAVLETPLEDIAAE